MRYERHLVFIPRLNLPMVSFSERKLQVPTSMSVKHVILAMQEMPFPNSQ